MTGGNSILEALNFEQLDKYMHPQMLHIFHESKDRYLLWTLHIVFASLC